MSAVDDSLQIDDTLKNETIPAQNILVRPKFVHQHFL